LLLTFLVACAAVFVLSTQVSAASPACESSCLANELRKCKGVQCSIGQIQDHCANKCGNRGGSGNHFGWAGWTALAALIFAIAALGVAIGAYFSPADKGATGPQGPTGAAGKNAVISFADYTLGAAPGVIPTTVPILQSGGVTVLGNSTAPNTWTLQSSYPAGWTVSTTAGSQGQLIPPVGTPPTTALFQVSVNLPVQNVAGGIASVVGQTSAVTVYLNASTSSTLPVVLGSTPISSTTLTYSAPVISVTAFSGTVTGVVSADFICSGSSLNAGLWITANTSAPFGTAGTPLTATVTYTGTPVSLTVQRILEFMFFVR